MKSLVATLGPSHDKPWWWKHLPFDRGQCQLDYERLVYKQLFSQDIPTLEIPIVMLKALKHLLKWRHRGYSYVFTFECDLVGLSIAFWQSITGMRRPKHVILQFIMRERQNNIRSVLKYVLLRCVFSSVHRVVVSSTSEVEYYRKAFDWPRQKIAFVPLHTSPELLNRTQGTEEEFYLAAGRSFRDYETLLRAITATNLTVLIVGGRGATAQYAGVDNVRVTEDISIEELEALMRRSRAVVVPLQDRAISVGQSVLLQAMALGKAVVATRTAGTSDYVNDMSDGILVAPGDAQELRDALLLLEDEGLRRKLGAGARSRVAAMYLPKHYASAIRDAIAT